MRVLWIWNPLLEYSILNFIILLSLIFKYLINALFPSIKTQSSNFPVFEILFKSVILQNSSPALISSHFRFLRFGFRLYNRFFIFAPLDKSFSNSDNFFLIVSIYSILIHKLFTLFARPRYPYVISNHLYLPAFFFILNTKLRNSLIFYLKLL